VQELRSGSSYLSNSDMRLHFGLGSNPVVDEIEVLWPNGVKERFAGTDTDRFVTLFETQGVSLTSENQAEKH